jgi:hypothetical protein
MYLFNTSSNLGEIFFCGSFFNNVGDISLSIKMGTEKSAISLIFTGTSYPCWMMYCSTVTTRSKSRPASRQKRNIHATISAQKCTANAARTPSGDFDNDGCLPKMLCWIENDKTLS